MTESQWDAEYRGITEEEWNKLVDNPIGQRFTPESLDIWERMMAENMKVCLCGHKKMDHSEDEEVEHYCSHYYCNCREFVEHKEV
ncbi:hypothetical protein PBI_ASERPROCKY_77 [Gordonia phage ASerpRocky]|uniref:Uncharacterized protein n=1 Tax=Gordonia phage ASerpRocky TaxID=2599841 RepID=A0A5J6TCA8_9CAUD|nr:hypothetical protein PBI_ASERPROCKY_77 [Gordonia phage ASerpRocky]